jgi:hypothetical protein
VGGKLLLELGTSFYDEEIRRVVSSYFGAMRATVAVPVLALLSLCAFASAVTTYGRDAELIWPAWKVRGFCRLFSSNSDVIF